MKFAIPASPEDRTELQLIVPNIFRGELSCDSRNIHDCSSIMTSSAFV